MYCYCMRPYCLRYVSQPFKYFPRKYLLPLLFAEYVFVKFCALQKELKLKCNVEYLQIFTINVAREKAPLFICTQLLNESSQEVPVGQVLKIFKFASKPEQPGLPSLICLEVIYVQRQVFFFAIVNEKRFYCKNEFAVSNFSLCYLPNR